MEKGKYCVLLSSDLVLENPNLYSPDSLDEISDLSEFSETSSSIELTENSSKEEQVDMIYFSENQFNGAKERSSMKPTGAAIWGCSHDRREGISVWESEKGERGDEKENVCTSKKG